MPNWKKLIASGSDASLNSLNVNGGLTAGGTITANSFNGNFSGTIDNNLISANQLNVSGNGTTSQFLRSDGDGTFTWATPTNTNYFLNGITKSGNTLTFSVNGTTNRTYTFGSNAFTSYSNHVGLYDSVGSADAVNSRIDSEVLPAIPTNNNQLTNGAGYTTNTGTMSSWKIKEGNGTETTSITNGETFTIEDGTGIQSELTSTTSGGTITITNTAPDQTVSLTGAGATTISGTYPNFTITSTDTNTDTNTQRSDEEIRDVAAAQWVNGTNTTVVKDDANNTIKINSTNTNTTYSAGTGLTLSGTTFSLTNTYDNYVKWQVSDGITNTNVVSGDKVTFLGGGATNINYDEGSKTFTISSTDTNTDTNTTYSAGTGLTLSGTTFSLTETYDNYKYWWLWVNNSQITKISTEGGVNFKPGSNVSISYVDDGDFDTVYISATDTNTTYTADGNYGMTLSGTTFRLENDRRRNSTTTDIYTGNTHDFTFYDASIGIRWYTAGSEDMRLLDNGTLHVDGDVIAYSTTISDRRLKDNITTIENPLDKIKALRGVEYDWNSGSRKGKRDLGLIAQEVEKVIPNIVHEHDMPLMDGAETDTLYKTVDYEKMVAVLIEGMKEQQSQIDELKSEISKLKGEA